MGLSDLVEVEGSREGIERAIEALAMPREGFLTDRLPDFIRRFEARTGARAMVSLADFAGGAHYDVSNA